jgi:predicted dehydrogenase
MGDQQQLRVGLVGCGLHGTNLAQAVARSSSLQLVACADPDESAARRAAGAAASASVHNSAESLLQRAAVDAVLVATPHDELARSCLAAIRAGKHVMVEKPMAMDDAQAREVESAAAAAGVNCMVGYSLRFSTGKYVHELIAAGHIGDVHAVTGAIGIPPMNRGWMSTTEHGGGPLLYVGCHVVDFVFWFTGDAPLSVYAEVRRRADTGTDELSGIQIKLANGGLAQLLVSQTRPAFAYQMHVYGGTGDIGLRGRNLFQAELEVFSSSTPEYREPTTIRPVLRGDAITTMLVPELEEFAQSIAERRAPAITTEDGRRVLQVLDAVGESARRGEPVAIQEVELATR